MAKHSMRGYYALGALVLGIILLYIVIRNVEPFANKTISVYANIDRNQKITYSGSNDASVKGVEAGLTKFTMMLPTTYKVQSVQYYKIGMNNSKCNKTDIINNTACWEKNDIVITPKISSGKVDLQGLTYIMFNPGSNKLPSTIDPTLMKDLKQNANIRIDLTLA